MATTEIALGVPARFVQSHLMPGVHIRIDGDIEMVSEVLQYIKKFKSRAGQIEVR